jgi:hypothetical protein
MNLPLAICQQFGQFAFQDEQKGIEAMNALQDFIAVIGVLSLGKNAIV